MGERHQSSAVETVLVFLLCPGALDGATVDAAIVAELGETHPLVARWRRRRPAPDGAETVAFARSVTDDEVATLNPTARRAFNDWTARREAMAAAAAARQARQARG
jgi:hypothetical protein